MTTPSASPVTLDIDAQIMDASLELSQNEAWLAIGRSNPEAQEAVAMSAAKLTSLRELKQRRDAEATRSVQSATMPEPVATCQRMSLRGDEYVAQHRITWRGGQPIAGDLYGPEVHTYYGDLLAAEKLKRENAELGERFHDDAANKYAAQVAYWMGKHDETADRLAKVMEALREPTQRMIDDGTEAIHIMTAGTRENSRARATEAFRAMSAALLSELGKTPQERQTK